MEYKELFLKGTDFQGFLKEGNEEEQEKVLRVLKNIELTDDTVDRIKSLGEHNILIFAEIWCPDCVVNVPATEKLNEINPSIKISFVEREGNEKYLEDFLVDGKAKIPTFILMDGDFKVIGSFIERPEAIKEIEESKDQIKIIVEKRRYRNGEYAGIAIEEVLKVLEEA